MAKGGASDGAMGELEQRLIDFFIDDVLARSAKHRRLGERIALLQGDLRGLVDDVAWQKYLEIEGATNARAAKEVGLVCKRMLSVLAHPRLDRGRG